MKSRSVRWIVALWLALVAAGPAEARKPDGVLELRTFDAETSEPAPVRIELADARGRRVNPKGWGQAPLGDHAYLAPSTLLGLRRGAYRFSIDAGPEYRTQQGHFEIDRHAEYVKDVPMRRFANMAEEGWIGVDLQNGRDPARTDLARRVERVSFAPPVTHRWAEGNWHATGVEGQFVGLWQDAQSAVWLYSAEGELGQTDLPNMSTAPAEAVASARRRGFRVVVDPLSPETPALLANDSIDAVWLLDGLAKDNYDTGIARVRAYYALLNSGARLPPLGGSGSGIERPGRRGRDRQITRPLGDGRTWVRGSADDTLADAWTSIELGQVVASNGPLLRPTANGRFPGATLYEPEALIALNLATRDKVDYLEIIADGEKALTVPLLDWARDGGRLPPISLAGKRWIAVRAITVAEDRLQMAHSGPWYVGQEVDAESATLTSD